MHDCIDHKANGYPRWAYGWPCLTHIMPNQLRQMLDQNLNWIVSRPNVTPGKILYCTTCILIDLMFRKNFPTDTQVWNSLSRLNDSRRRRVIWVTLPPLYGVLPVPYVPVQVSRCALVAHWYAYVLPGCRVSYYLTAGLVLPSLYLLRMILLTLYLMVWDWRVLRAWPMPVYWPKLLISFASSIVFPFSSFFLWAGTVGLVSLDWWGVYRFLPSFHCIPF